MLLPERKIGSWGLIAILNFLVCENQEEQTMSGHSGETDALQIQEELMTMQIITIEA